MDKLDLVLYVLVALVAFHVLGALVRTYNGWYRDGGKLYDFIQRELAKGNFESALGVCERHLERKPHDGRLLYLRAKLLYKLGKHTEAITAFEELKRRDPVWAEDADVYIQTIRSAT